MVGLVADIGSTNARFALVEKADPATAPVLAHTASFICAEYASLADVMAAYLKDRPPHQKPDRATLAVAGPISGDRVRLTNHNWAFSVTETRTQFELTHLHVINDFTAISLSLPHLPAAALAVIGPAMMTADPRCVGVLGPGSGLGVGGLLRLDGRYVPLSSEGGHMSFAPTTEMEINLARILFRRFGHVSNERLLSGPGLIHIYEALNGLSNRTGRALDAKQIVDDALRQNDTACVETLDHFCAILGGVAGDLAMMLNAEAIYVAGGIVPRFIDFLRASRFRAQFENKGRFAARLAQVATPVIVEPNPGLLGAAVDLSQME